MTELMRRRRALMVAGKSPRIPSAYQEVEWAGVDTYSSPYDTRINLDYVPTVSPRFVAEVKKYGGAVFGTTDTNPIFTLREVNNNCYAAYGGTAVYLGKSVIGADWKEIDCGKDVYIGGALKKTFNYYDWSGNTDSVSMLYGYNAGTGYLFKSAKLYDGDSLVRDLVPCYRKSDDSIGFYCLVSNQFYTNAGANSIMAKGADV